MSTTPNYQKSQQPHPPPQACNGGTYCDPQAFIKYVHMPGEHKSFIQKPGHRRRAADYLRAGLIVTGLAWLLLTIGAGVLSAQSQLPQITQNSAAISELRADQKAQASEIALIKTDVAVMRSQMNLLLQIGWGALGAIGMLLLERGVDYLRGPQKREGKRS